MFAKNLIELITKHRETVLLLDKNFNELQDEWLQIEVLWSYTSYAEFKTIICSFWYIQVYCTQYFKENQVSPVQDTPRSWVI